MTDREILQKSIEKAENNGFNIRNINCFDTFDIPPKLYVRFLLCKDFAKAFCGEDKLEPQDSYDFEFRYKGNLIGFGYYSLWKYHLQQMVLYEEPLKYLEKFLDK